MLLAYLMAITFNCYSNSLKSGVVKRMKSIREKGELCGTPAGGRTNKGGAIEESYRRMVLLVVMSS